MDKVWFQRLTSRGLLLVSLLALPCLTLAEFKKGPYLVYKNNQTQMTIMWEQAASGAGVVSWGNSTSYGSSGTGTVVSGNLYSYNITGLTPGQKVFYKVVANGKTAQNFFYAVPNHNNAVTLYAGGDSRDGTVNKGHSLTEQVFSRMLTDIDQNQAARNTLMLFSGDMVGVGNSDSDWQKWFKPEYSGYSQTPSMTAFFQRIPVMNTIGNHETYANDANNLDLTAAKTRKFYPYSYVNINNGLYYTFTYGPVRILVIDNERSISTGSAQYQWIENTLVNNTSPFVIALYHRPAYGAGYDTSNWIWMQTVVTPLLKQYGVKIAFNGHDHFYNRSVVDGFHHITTGGMTDQRTPSSPSHSVKKSSSLHFCRIECDPATGKAKITAITSTGAIIESFEVQHTVSAPTTPVVSLAVPSGNVTVPAGTNLYVKVNATDPDGISQVRLYKDGVRLARTEGGAPYEWSAAGQNDPELQNLQPGSFVLTAEATDTKGTIGTTTSSVTVTVGSGNQAPYFTADPFSIADATVGTAYSQSISGSAVDPEGGTKTYSKDAGPVWLTVAASGAATGTPGSADVGTNSFSVRVADSGGLSDTATLRVVVKAASTATVPWVTNLTEAAAGTAITNAGLVVSGINRQYHATVAAGLIFSQTPGGNTSVAPGSSVALASSLGPQPSSNIVVNGSFETSTNGWKLVGSANRSTNSAAGGGVASLRINTASSSATQYVGIVSGKTYDISVNVNVSARTAGTVVFDTGDKYDAAGQGQFAFTATNGGWKVYSGSFTATNNFLTIRMFSDASFAGTAYFDLIELKAR